MASRTRTRNHRRNKIIPKSSLENPGAVQPRQAHLLQGHLAAYLAADGAEALKRAVMPAPLKQLLRMEILLLL
jgi:hypothetical protein